METAEGKAKEEGEDAGITFRIFIIDFGSLLAQLIQVLADGFSNQIDSNVFEKLTKAM